MKGGWEEGRRRESTRKERFPVGLAVGREWVGRCIYGRETEQGLHLGQEH